MDFNNLILNNQNYKKYKQIINLKYNKQIKI